MLYTRFRWVVCQLDEIKKCLKVETLRNTLRSLPKDLDSTYARILCNINEQHKKDALTILLWLTFSRMPLTIEEVAEATAINLKCSPQFDEDRRLRDPRDVLQICSSLVTISISKEERWYENGDGDDNKVDDDNNDYYVQKFTGEIRLAHFSVKEYLVSDRIRLGLAHYFSLDKDPHAEIAQACLVYLQTANIDLENRSRSPLAQYSARYLCDHAKLATMKKEATNPFMDFLRNKEAFVKSTRIYHPDYKHHLTANRTFEPITPLYYASVFGIFEVFHQLLRDGANPNVLGGALGSPLQAA